MTQRNDGSYYADGRVVHKSPEKAKTESGTGITIGFPVCQLSEWVGDEAAQVIADALNAARSPAPEGGETDPRDELLREAVQVIEHALFPQSRDGRRLINVQAFYEWGGCSYQTFVPQDRLRATLAKLQEALGDE
ncbi:MAG: hypothetical protein ACTS10_21835 [Kiloniellales bacterium]